MFDLSKIQVNSGDSTPPLIILHGQPGIGKTTLACGAPDVIVIPTEHGLGSNEVAAFPVVTKYSEFEQAMNTLLTEDHPFKTVVVDSVSALAPLVDADIAEKHNAESIADISFGVGRVRATDEWVRLRNGFRKLNQRGIAVILIGHTENDKIDPPDEDPYTRHELALEKRARAVLVQEADVIGHCRFKTFVRTETTSKGKAKGPGKAGATGRVVQLENSPSGLAKSRYSLKTGIYETDLMWESFSRAIPYYANNSAAVAPQTVEGAE